MQASYRLRLPPPTAQGRLGGATRTMGAPPAAAVHSTPTFAGSLLVNPEKWATSLAKQLRRAGGRGITGGCRRRGAATVAMAAEGGVYVKGGNLVQVPKALPCLPFPPEEAFTPGATKSLHLFEARYLSLLEEALASDGRLFAHIIVRAVAPGSDPEEEGMSLGQTFIASSGCLAEIEDVKTMPVGAVVRVRGIGRVRVKQLTSLSPYIKGEVSLMEDEAVAAGSEGQIVSDGRELEETLRGVADLSRRLTEGSPQEEGQSFSLDRSLQWVEEAGEGEGVERAQRLSFAALQAVPGSTTNDLKALLQKRLRGLEVTDTSERLAMALEYARELQGSLSAKVAIKSLGISAGEAFGDESGEEDRGQERGFEGLR